MNNGNLSTSNAGDATQFTDDSFTFKAKNNLNTTTTTNNSLFSKGSSKFKVRNFRKKVDNTKNILADSNLPDQQHTGNQAAINSDDEEDNILAGARGSLEVKVTMNLWLPKLEYAENMLLNEDRTDLRTDVKLISQLVKKQPELFDQTVHYLECFDSELISVILDKTLREIQARFVTDQSHIFLSMETELYRVKMARSSGLPDAKNNISSERSVKDIKATSYFIDYSPMALILNMENGDYDSERMKTFASFQGDRFSFENNDNNNNLDEAVDDIIADSMSRDRSSVVTDRDQLEPGDDILNTSMGSMSIQTNKSKKQRRNKRDDYGQGDRGCEAKCTIF